MRGGMPANHMLKTPPPDSGKGQCSRLGDDCCSKWGDCIWAPLDFWDNTIAAIRRRRALMNMTPSQQAEFLERKDA